MEPAVAVDEEVLGLGLKNAVKIGKSRFNLDDLNLDPEVKEIIQTEINRLNQRLKDEKTTVHEAAKLGNQLLQEKHFLSEENDELKLQLNRYKTLVEELQQEKHSLTMKLKNVNLNESVDFDALSEKLESVELVKKKLILEKTALEKKIQEIQTERTELEEKRDEMLDALWEKEKEIQDLKMELNEMKEKETNSSALSSNTSESDAISDNEELKKRCRIAIKMQINLQDELNDKKKIIRDLMNKVERLEVEVADKDEEIKHSFATERETKQQMEEYREEIELLKFQQFDENKRGNCLFSEVEDHRKVLEAKLSREMEINQAHLDKIDFLTKQNAKIKTQLNTLLCLKGQRVDRNRITDLEGSLSQARNEITRLNQLLNEKAMESPVEIKKLNVTRVDAMSESSDSLANKHLNILLNKAKLEVEKKEKEIASFRKENHSISEELIRAKDQLYHAEHQIESLQSEIMSLKNRILVLKSSSSVSGNENENTKSTITKQSGRVEKINLKRETIPTPPITIKDKFQPSSRSSVLPNEKENQSSTLKDLLNVTEVKKESPKMVSWKNTPEVIKPLKDGGTGGGNDGNSGMVRNSGAKSIVPTIKSAEMESIIETEIPDCKQQ